MQYAKSILDQVGIGGNRLEMYNMSSAMGKRWAEVCTEMTERIKEMGPSPARRAARNGEAGASQPVTTPVEQADAADEAAGSCC